MHIVYNYMDVFKKGGHTPQTVFFFHQQSLLRKAARETMFLMRFPPGLHRTIIIHCLLPVGKSN